MRELFVVAACSLFPVGLFAESPAPTFHSNHAMHLSHAAQKQRRAVLAKHVKRISNLSRVAVAKWSVNYKNGVAVSSPHRIISAPQTPTTRLPRALEKPLVEPKAPLSINPHGSIALRMVAALRKDKEKVNNFGTESYGKGEHLVAAGAALTSALLTMTIEAVDNAVPHSTPSNQAVKIQIKRDRHAWWRAYQGRQHNDNMTKAFAEHRLWADHWVRYNGRFGLLSKIAASGEMAGLSVGYTLVKWVPGMRKILGGATPPSAAFILNDLRGIKDAWKSRRSPQNPPSPDGNTH